MRFSVFWRVKGDENATCTFTLFNFLSVRYFENLIGIVSFYKPFLNRMFLNVSCLSFLFSSSCSFSCFCWINSLSGFDRVVVRLFFCLHSCCWVHIGNSWWEWILEWGDRVLVFFLVWYVIRQCSACIRGGLNGHWEEFLPWVWWWDGLPRAVVEFAFLQVFKRRGHGIKGHGLWWDLAGQVDGWS